MKLPGEAEPPRLGAPGIHTLSEYDPLLVSAVFPPGAMAARQSDWLVDDFSKLKG